MAEVEVREIGEHWCPRRAEGVPRGLEDVPDRWVVRDDPDHPGLLNNGLSSCTFCGSLDPDSFIQKIKEGWIVGPTDKNYKVYFTNDSGTLSGKFYFQHLSRMQQGEFVDLYNDRAITIGPPGRFYVPPFFMRFQ